VNGHVDLQARPAPPNSQWEVVLDIEVRNGGVFTYTFSGVTTDQSGDFSVGGITPGIYDIWLKNFHTLSNLKQNVTLNAGPNSVDMGELQDGDASDDNIVNILDFGWLKVQFGTAGPEADFNQDGLVDIVDFGVLKVNFGEMGDVIVTAMSPGRSSTQKTERLPLGDSDIGDSLAALQEVAFVMSPSTEKVAVGEEFSVDIQVDAGSCAVDSIQAYVNLDPVRWDVVDIVDGEVPSNLSKHYDSASGQLGYAWASLDSSVEGSFTLCTIKLRARQAADGYMAITLDPEKTKVNVGMVSLRKILHDTGVTMASGIDSAGSNGASSR